MRGWTRLGGSFCIYLFFMISFSRSIIGSKVRRLSILLITKLSPPIAVVVSIFSVSFCFNVLEIKASH